MPEIVLSQIIITPQKRTSSSQKLALHFPPVNRNSSERQRRKSRRRAEDWRSQPSVPVGQRLDPLFPGSSGVSSSPSFSFQRQTVEGISLARREPWVSSNRDFSSGARRMEPNVSVHHGGKMSQQK
jgi:hypothetical protein